MAGEADEGGTCDATGFERSVMLDSFEIDGKAPVEPVLRLGVALNPANRVDTLAEDEERLKVAEFLCMMLVNAKDVDGCTFDRPTDEIMAVMVDNELGLLGLDRTMSIGLVEDTIVYGSSEKDVKTGETMVVIVGNELEPLIMDGRVASVESAEGPIVYGSSVIGDEARSVDAVPVPTDRTSAVDFSFVEVFSGSKLLICMLVVLVEKTTALAVAEDPDPLELDAGSEIGSEAEGSCPRETRLGGRDIRLGDWLELTRPGESPSVVGRAGTNDERLANIWDEVEKSLVGLVELELRCWRSSDIGIPEKEDGTSRLLRN